MADVTFAMQAKSDQLNACDLSGDLVIRIRDVRVMQSDQPVWIYFDGDNNRPWKPSKGMVRVLAKAWGNDSDTWIGQNAQIYCDPTVKWAGKEVGGIRVRALSGIHKNGMETILVTSKQQRGVIKIAFLEVQGRQAYPSEKFDTALPAMREAMESGKMTLHAVIAHCQKTGDLSAQQLKQLEDAAPIETEEGDL